jgi:hypothetical protein
MRRLVLWLPKMVNAEMQTFQESPSDSLLAAALAGEIGARWAAAEEIL